MKIIPTKKKPSPREVLLPLMKKLVEADKNLREFQAKHEKVLGLLDNLKEEFSVLENQLRTEAKKIGSGYAEDSVEVEYVMPMHRYYDPEILEQKISEKILKPLGVIETKKVVNEKLLKMLVKANKVKKSVIQQAYREEPTGSPRVTITIKKEE